MILPAQVELLAWKGFGTISSGASKTAASQRPSRNWTEASGASDLGSDPSRPVLRPESRSIMQSELRAEAAKERSAPSPPAAADATFIVLQPILSKGQGGAGFNIPRPTERRETTDGSGELASD